MTDDHHRSDDDDEKSFSYDLDRLSSCKTRESLISCLLDLRVRVCKSDIDSNEWSTVHAIALTKRRECREEWTSGVNNCYRMLCEYKRKVTVRRLKSRRDPSPQDSTLCSIEGISIPSVSFKIDSQGRKYAVYVIRVECDNKEEYIVERRFREFGALHERLQQKYPEVSLRDLNLRLPRKIMSHLMGQFSKRMLSLRRKALSDYLTTLVGVQIQGKQLEDLQEFLDLRRHVQQSYSSSSPKKRNVSSSQKATDDASLTISLPRETTSTALSLLYDTRFLSKVCEGNHFESTMQDILYGVAGSESQKMREFLRKFKNAWQQQQKQASNAERDTDMFFQSTRNFIAMLSADISTRFRVSLSRAIETDLKDEEGLGSEKDFVQDAVCREVESALMKQIGSQLEMIAMKSTAEEDMKTLEWIDGLQRGGLPLPIKSNLFGIRPCFQSSKTWYRDAIEILNSLDKILLPSDKLRALLRFSETILSEAREVSRGVEHVTADDLVPIMIYAVASSSLEHPHTTLALIRHLSSPRLCRGEAEYYLTVFESVLYYLSSKSHDDGDVVDGEALTNRYGNDAIVDLRTPRRVQSRRLLGALSFDVNAEIKAFHENPLRVWVRDVSLKCRNSTKSRFRKTLTSTFHLACVYVNSKKSSKRRHCICYIDRTQSDLEQFQEQAERWISSHSENVHLPTLPRDLSSTLTPHALSQRLRSANIRDKKKNPDESIRSTLTRMLRSNKSVSESKMTTTQILLAHCQEVDQYLKRFVQAIQLVCKENKNIRFPPKCLHEFMGLPSKVLV